MGIYSRPDSPWWWLWLETASAGQQKEKTAVRIGTTALERRDNKALAEQVYRERMRELAMKIHRLPVAPHASTFSAFSDWYDTNISAHHRGVLREREILKTLRAEFGGRQLAAITATAVLEWRTRRALTRSANTVNRELDVLKAMLRAAVPTYLDASPVAGIRRLRPQRREMRILTPKEEVRLLAVLPKADRALVICALDTLMRLSDVVNLTRDQDRGKYLVVVDPKVEPYKVPVSQRLRLALDALPKSGRYFFGHRRQAKKARDFRSGIKSMLKRACKRARIRYGRKKGGLTFHGLRHTAATRLVEGGVPIRVVQELGGWKSLRQLERYAHPTEATKVAAVELISRA